MIRIEVVGHNVKQVVKKATGEIFNIPEVQAYAHGISKYPVEIKFGIAKGANPPVPGMYELDSSSFYAGPFNKLTLREQLVLRPIAEAAAKRAA
jgi:hypothetical protein